MNKNETASVVFRVLSAYPQHSRLITNEMTEAMITEWYEGLKSLPSDSVMEAVTSLVSEMKWMPALSEVIAKIQDLQLGSNADIIRALDRAISSSSNCIIFGQVTEEQERGYEKLTPLQKLIVRSPYEFNVWLTRDCEWKEERVKLIKKEIQFGRHQEYLNGTQQSIGNNFDIFKALEERRHGENQQQG